MSVTPSEWIAVCDLGDIPPLGARVVTRPAGAPIALFRTASDTVFALLDRCPHKGGPLSQGIVHGEQVACPLHGFNIAFESGRALPPDDGCATVFRVKREGDAVLLDRAELATLGVDDAPQPIAFVAPGAAA
ncbi:MULTISPECIES: nitrite reductase small subunit NirD [Burkholderia]|uniref:Nitrite reductase n=1 Tax=Burkholderia mayonis TaxID=1385591 RepID=A0A1B4FJ25_9BURK|nr:MULTISPECIES: nitrite reductase small subunit NirD [Burkholderia]AOJ03650.1 nitrite reductase [Burkholderia mayonis]KVE39088.1 nitrite reductase [Burkholderia sp. BDU5]KVE48298.1 nitrite reductase [Burkholderia mayonis]